MEDPTLDRETDTIDPIHFQYDVTVALSNLTNIQESLDLLLDYAFKLDIVDSVGLFIVNETTEDLDLIAHKGVPPGLIERGKHIPKKSSFAEFALKGKPIYRAYSDLTQNEEEITLTYEGIKAIAIIPIKCKDEVEAVIILGSHKHKELEDNSKILLETIAAQIGILISRLKAERKLEYEIKVQKMLGMISKRFIDLEPEKADQGIELSFQEIGNLINASRLVLYKKSKASGHFRKTHEWCAEGIETSLDQQPIDAEKLSFWWKEKINKQDTIVIHDVQTLDGPEKDTFLKSGTKSAVILPLKYQGDLKGYLVVDFKSDGKNLSDNTINMLEFVTEIFVNALEHKTKEEKLKGSERKYRRIFEEIHDVYFELDMDGTVINISPSVKKIGMYSEDEVIGHNSREFHKNPVESNNIFDELKHLGQINDFEYEFVTRTGETRVMSLNAHIFHDDETNSPKVAGTLRDVTEKRNNEKLLVEAKLLAENTSRTKSEFLSNVSHELRTPLNLVLGYSDILLEGDANSLTEKQRKYVEAIKTGGTRLLDQVNSLIYISEIETGSAKFEPTVFFVPELISDIKRITGSIAFKKRIAIEFNIESNIREVYADVSKFKTILHHLITNAIKFTPDDGRVSVNMCLDNEHNLQVTVKDTGIGIAEEDMNKLFKPFVQLDGSINRKYGGTGLGLSLVKELVEMHGGTIAVKSKVGEGSDFTFVIPFRNPVSHS